MTVNLPVVNSDKHDIDNISSDLSQLIDGDILSKEWERSIYSTDASPYEIMPLCVVLPKSNEDVIKTVKYASENRIPIIARGGGSGLAGQAIVAGIIIDFSKYMNEIKEINTENNYVIVQPGIFKSVLDQKLKKQNKFLPPDPSSSDMCTAGGMIANNVHCKNTNQNQIKMLYQQFRIMDQPLIFFPKFYPNFMNISFGISFSK